ncbi:MAG: FkbM family methyltransferase [Armatimonadota bacterium]|nr:MAG: FkbM family methyltransferase [Armatimonadota bacterium]
MFEGIRRRIRKHRQKHTFSEYGFEVKTFCLREYGRVQYAQWLHPAETKKDITDEMIASLRTFILEGDTVIDIGAHTGDTTVPMAVVAGRSGCAFAIEPNPYVFQVLAANAKLNPTLTNIVPLNFAATETDGSFTFHYSDASYCNGGYLSHTRRGMQGHRYPLEVEGRNLEAFLRREHAERLGRLSYVKIDAEGYDKDIIESLMGVLQQYRPVLVTEVFKRLVREEREGLFDVLDRAGYKHFRLASGANPQGEEVRRTDMTKWDRFDILALPRR